MKKITITILFMILLASTLSASLPQVLGWAISFKQGSTEIKALCTVSGPACEGVQFVMNPGGYIKGETLGFLGEASPELGQVVNAVTNPEGFVTQQALTEIAKKNAEVARGLDKALTISDQLKTLGVTDGKAEINKEGTVTKANFEIKKEGQVGNIISKEVEKEEVIIRDVKLDKKDKETKLTFSGDESYAKIGESLFMNIKKQDKKTNAYLILGLSENGKVKVKELDITTTEKGGTFVFGNDRIDAPPETRLFFKDGKLILIIPDNGMLEKAPSLLKPRTEGNTIEIWGENIKLPGGFILQDGTLSYKNGQAYVEESGIAQINGVKIDNTWDEPGRVNVYFDGKKHETETEDYISFGKKELFIYGNEKYPYKPEFEFQEGNPYLKFDEKSDRFLIKDVENVLINIENRDEEGLIPSLSIQKLSEFSNIHLENGEIKIRYTDKLAYIAEREIKTGEKTTTPMSVTYSDKDGKIYSFFSTEPQKVIISNFNELVTVPLDTEEIQAEFYYTQHSSRKDYAPGTVSERLDFNYLPQTAWFEEDTVMFKPNEYDWQKIEEAIKKNPGKLIISGVTNNAVIKRIGDTLDNLPPDTRYSIRGIIVYPDELYDKIRGKKSGAFTGPDRIIRLRASWLEESMIYHEAAHDLTWIIEQQEDQEYTELIRKYVQRPEILKKFEEEIRIHNEIDKINAEIDYKYGEDRIEQDKFEDERDARINPLLDKYKRIRNEIMQGRPPRSSLKTFKSKFQSIVGGGDEIYDLGPEERIKAGKSPIYWTDESIKMSKEDSKKNFELFKLLHEYGFITDERYNYIIELAKEVEIYEGKEAREVFERSYGYTEYMEHIATSIEDIHRNPEKEASKIKAGVMGW
ncbi:MAG: hypothetical protein ISS23_00545 [Nanoarchaeota archaeon]|nr:hypothetical protein [Nanoarchaeota archaeon]